MADILADGVEDLKTDKVNGAHTLATKTLEYLLRICTSDQMASSSSVLEFSNRLFVSAHILSQARPSMRPAIANNLTRTLNTLLESYPSMLSPEHADNEQDRELHKVRDDAAKVIEREVQSRHSQSQERLGLAKSFYELLKCQNEFHDSNSLSVSTLSTSSSVLKALIYTAKQMPSDHQLEVRILESRPAFEGISMAQSLLQGTDSRLKVTIAPESHFALMTSSDLLLLGADSVAANGAVMNKMGSLAAAICAKRAEKKVFVICESEKISWEDHEAHPAENAIEPNDPSEVWSHWDPQKVSTLQKHGERCKVLNFYFEWVPPDLIDGYITENGYLSKEDILNLAQTNRDYEYKVFIETGIKTLFAADVW
jgi:translation initiation factor 2B subunit (eIF-2B alpha/beta/delta family)